MRIKTLSAPSLLSLDSLCFILKSRPADGSLTPPPSLIYVSTQRLTRVMFSFLFFCLIRLHVGFPDQQSKAHRKSADTTLDTVQLLNV